MSLTVTPSGAGFGALITGVDLRGPLSADLVEEVRSQWLRHQVIAFPDQSISIEDLERFAACLGPRGDDPYVAPIAGHPHVIEVRREPDERTPIFAEGWHSDWSFLASPPAGTALYGSVIPPVGGDTCFADQYAAWEELPSSLKRRVEGRQAIHSARRGYSRQGLYGERDAGRSMAIRYDDSALATQRHPLVRTHPETGRPALFVNPGYTIGIDGLDRDESAELLKALFAHQGEDRFVYRHAWRQGMLTLWDNRCLLHRATGGYEGHRRLLYRITIAERPIA